MVGVAAGGTYYWTDLSNPTSTNCDGTTCTGVLQWQSDSSQFDYSMYPGNPTVKGDFGKQCVALRDGEINGKLCGLAYEVMCRNDACIQEPACNAAPAGAAVTADGVYYYTQMAGSFTWYYTIYKVPQISFKIEITFLFQDVRPEHLRRRHLAGRVPLRGRVGRPYDLYQ